MLVDRELLLSMGCALIVYTCRMQQMKYYLRNITSKPCAAHQVNHMLEAIACVLCVLRPGQTEMQVDASVQTDNKNLS